MKIADDEKISLVQTFIEEEEVSFLMNSRTVNCQ